MRRFLIASASVLAFASAASAFDICKSYPQNEWMSKEALTQKVEAMGYQVGGIKAEDGCWEVKGKKDGKRVEDYFDPKTGELVKSK